MKRRTHAVSNVDEPNTPISAGCAVASGLDSFDGRRRERTMEPPSKRQTVWRPSWTDRTKSGSDGGDDGYDDGPNETKVNKRADTATTF